MIAAVSADPGTTPPTQFAGLLQFPLVAAAQKIVPPGATTSKLAVVSLANPGLVALSVYPMPGRSIARSLNVATPPLAVRVSVPASDPEPGFVPIAIVTSPANAGVALPARSFALTCTAEEKTTPVSTAPGAAANTSCAGAPGMTTSEGFGVVTGVPSMLAPIDVPVPASSPVNVAV